jgi:hypothetical protein
MRTTKHCQIVIKSQKQIPLYAISLRISGNKQPIKGDSSIKLRSPLKLTEIMPENLHA